MTATEAALREFCARIVGYARTEAVERALDSIHLCVAHCAALVLLGTVDADLISIARGLHRRTIGGDQPFAVCDQRLRHRASAVAAARSARGGTLCVRRRRLPADFRSAVPMLRDPAAAVQLVVCAESSFDVHPLATLPIPIMVPPIQERASELVRIVDAYAFDAVSSLGDACFFDEDRAWVLEHAAGSLAEIEAATLRLAALRQAGSIYAAAARLRISNVTLGQWLKRRGKVLP